MDIPLHHPFTVKNGSSAPELSRKGGERKEKGGFLQTLGEVFRAEGRGDPPIQGPPELPSAQEVRVDNQALAMNEKLANDSGPVPGGVVKVLVAGETGPVNGADSQGSAGPDSGCEVSLTLQGTLFALPNIKLPILLEGASGEWNSAAAADSTELVSAPALPGPEGSSLQQSGSLRGSSAGRALLNDPDVGSLLTQGLLTARMEGEPSLPTPWRPEETQLPVQSQHPLRNLVQDRAQNHDQNQNQDQNQNRTQVQFDLQEQKRTGRESSRPDPGPATANPEDQGRVDGRRWESRQVKGEHLPRPAASPLTSAGEVPKQKAAPSRDEGAKAGNHPQPVTSHGKGAERSEGNHFGPHLLARLMTRLVEGFRGSPHTTQVTEFDGSQIPVRSDRNATVPTSSAGNTPPGGQSPSTPTTAAPEVISLVRGDLSTLAESGDGGEAGRGRNADSAPAVLGGAQEEGGANGEVEKGRGAIHGKSRPAPAGEQEARPIQSHEGGDRPSLAPAGSTPRVTKEFGSQVRETTMAPARGLPDLPPALAQSVIHQIVREATMLVQAGASEMRLRLQPEMLGEVALRIRVEEGRMEARLDVSQASVKSAVESNLPQLRQALADRGLVVQRFDVCTSGDAPGRDQDAQRGQTRRRKDLPRETRVEAMPAGGGARLLGYNTIDVTM